MTLNPLLVTTLPKEDFRDEVNIDFMR